MLAKTLLIVALAAAPAFAQRGGGGSGGENAGAGGMPMQRPQPLSKGAMFANRLDLDRTQRETVQEIMNEAFKEIAPLRTQTEQTRAQIASSIITNGRQEDIDKLMAEYSAAAARITDIQAKAFGKVCALLKPNQKSKASSAFDLWAGTLDPAGGIARGGGVNRGKR